MEYTKKIFKQRTEKRLQVSTVMLLLHNLFACVTTWMNESGRPAIPEQVRGRQACGDPATGPDTPLKFRRSRHSLEPGVFRAEKVRNLAFRLGSDLVTSVVIILANIQ